MVETSLVEQNKQRRLGIIVGVALLAVIVVGVGLYLLLSRGGDSTGAGASAAPATATATAQATEPASPTVDASVTAPSGATESGAIVFGNADADTTVAVYLDFMCPYCGMFEQTNGEDLQAMADTGDIRLDYHPMSFLDKASMGAQYSTRAANAFATIADAAPDKALAFATEMFNEQPDENTEGLSDDQIAQIALGVGVPQTVVDTFADNKFYDWVAAATSADFAQGITGTPTALINGEKFTGDFREAGQLKAAIESGVASTPTPVPTIDPTVTSPAGSTAEGAILFGNVDAATTVAVYFDFMCPYCGMFETTNGADLEEMANAGDIRLEYHPMSFLDGASKGTEYSTRAANAFATVADAAPDHALDFSNALFARQPDENTEGLNDEQIAQIALDAGVPQAVVDTFADLKFADWVAAATTSDWGQGLTGTPTAMINGQKFEGDFRVEGQLKAAIEAAQ